MAMMPGCALLLRQAPYSSRGWRSKFGTTKCKTANISEFRNFEYKNYKCRIIRFFHFQIYFLFLRFLKLLEHSK